MSEHHHVPPPSDLHPHPHTEQSSHQHHHPAGHTGERHQRGQGHQFHTTADPYPFVYSKDPFDARRYSLFGRATIGRTSRGETIFAVVIIVAVLGVGLITMLLLLAGGH